MLSGVCKTLTVNADVLEKSCSEYNVDVTKKMEQEIIATGKSFREVKQKQEKSLAV